MRREKTLSEITGRPASRTRRSRMPWHPISASGLEAIRFLDRSREIAAEPVMAGPRAVHPPR